MDIPLVRASDSALIRFLMPETVARREIIEMARRGALPVEALKTSEVRDRKFVDLLARSRDRRRLAVLQTVNRRRQSKARRPAQSNSYKASI